MVRIIFSEKIKEKLKNINEKLQDDLSVFSQDCELELINFDNGKFYFKRKNSNKILRLGEGYYYTCDCQCSDCNGCSCYTRFYLTFYDIDDSELPDTEEELSKILEKYPHRTYYLDETEVDETLFNQFVELYQKLKKIAKILQDNPEFSLNKYIKKHKIVIQFNIKVEEKTLEEFLKGDENE